MNCIIVDDEEVSRMILRGVLDRIRTNNNIEIRILAECANYEEATHALGNHELGNIDVVFLDIEMPGKSGIEMIKEATNLPQIILVSSRPDFGSEAFECGVTDYVIKPLSFPRLEKAVMKAVNNLSREILDTHGDTDIFVKSDNKIVRIDLDDIYFVEALSDYVKIHTKDKFYVVHSTMKSIEGRLNSPSKKGFVRVHRSFIVNIDKVNKIDDLMIMMPTKAIPISSSYKQGFFNKLNMI